MSRPTELTPELAAELCLRLSQHGSLRRVCADPEMPTDNRVRGWVASNPEFAAAYARAKEAGIHALVEEGMDIVDEMPPTTAAGATDSGYVSWAKERAGYRRWLAERMMPKVYGVTNKQEVSGPNGGPIQTLIATGVPEATPSADDIC